MKILRTTLAMTVAAALLAPAAQADPVSLCNEPIQMSDGVTLRANVFLPKPDVRVPVVLTITGYNKDTNNPLGLPGCGSSSAIASGNTKLLDTGRLRRGLRLDPGAEVVERQGRDERHVLHGHHVLPRGRAGCETRA
jgi:hypothetical protein